MLLTQSRGDIFLGPYLVLPTPRARCRFLTHLLVRQSVDDVSNEDFDGLQTFQG